MQKKMVDWTLNCHLLMFEVLYVWLRIDTENLDQQM